MLHAIVEANRKRKEELARRVIAACGGSVAGRDIALLGLTFKPDTDDMRESPAIPLAEELHACGARVRGYDPAGMNNARRLLPMLKLSTDAYSCIHGAHAAVLVTDWPQFQNLDLRRVRSLLADPVFIDLRNAFDPRIMLGAGLSYVGIGRKLAGSAASGRIPELTDPRASSSKTAEALESDPGAVEG
jgi:UDPglucose 6-dehydrogenase